MHTGTFHANYGTWNISECAVQAVSSTLPEYYTADNQCKNCSEGFYLDSVSMTCKELDECDSSEFESIAPSSTRNRKCEPCPPGSTCDGTRATPCNPPTRYEFTAASAHCASRARVGRVCHGDWKYPGTAGNNLLGVCGAELDPSGGWPIGSGACCFGSTNNKESNYTSPRAPPGTPLMKDPLRSISSGVI